jgi:hypothetical protein
MINKEFTSYFLKIIDISQMFPYGDLYKDLIVKAKALSDAAKAVHDREWNGGRIIPAMNEPIVSTTSLKVVNTNYLLSEEVEVPTVMLDNFVVTADKGLVVDLNGNPKQTFNPGEKFRIKYNTPESVSINVTIKSSASYDHVYAYKNYTNHVHCHQPTF